MAFGHAPRMRGGRRLRLAARIALPALALTAAVCGSGAKQSTPTATAVLTTATAVPTKLPPGEPATGGSGPPNIESRELPDDQTGATTWVEATSAGATWRFPTGSEWEMAGDNGVGGNGFAGLPNFRVTHLTSGQARVYSLVDGALLLCSDRSAVLRTSTPFPSSVGTPVECAAQPLTGQERVVFAHVRVTGSYDRYCGPRSGEATYPGLTLPTARPNPRCGTDASPTPASPTATATAAASQPGGASTPEPAAATPSPAAQP